MSTIAYSNPRITYAMPSEGVNLNILAVLSHIEDHKCILVNPCPGFFEYVTNASKHVLLHLVQETAQTVTINDAAQPMSKRQMLLEESIEFMAKKSDAIFLIYNSNDRTERFDEIERALADYDDKVIVCDYAV